MRIWVRPDVIAKLGLTMNDLIKAVKEQNQINPAGKFGGNPAPAGTQFTYTALLQARLITVEDFGNIIVRSNADGSQVRLKDVARLELGTENFNSIGKVNGKPGAAIAVYQVPGSNALETAANIKKAMEELSARFPQDLADLMLFLIRRWQFRKVSVKLLPHSLRQFSWLFLSFLFFCRTGGLL